MANGARINLKNGTKYLVWQQTTKKFQRCVLSAEISGQKIKVKLIDTGETLTAWINEVSSEKDRLIKLF